MRKVLQTLPLLLLAGCASAPKPQELINLETLRQGKPYQVAREQQAALIKKSEKAYKSSDAAWQDQKLDDAKHWAMMATIQARTALTLVARAAATERVAKAEKELTAQKTERQRLAERIRAADEQLRLHKQLEAARKAAKEKEAALTEAQKREEEQKKLAAAQKQVAEAQLALKLADTVEASKYAQSDYSGAQSLVVRAEEALKAGNAVDAGATAQMAKTRAEAAYNAARPQYKAARQTAARQAQNQALQKDAAAIAGVTVKMKTVGQTQQLIIPVLACFRRAKVTPRPEKVGVLNEVGTLLKKYPDYPVLVRGYTSTRVAGRQRYAVSQARAQQVANHLASMGVEFKRFAVSGLGSESPVDRPYSNTNDRVEIVVLFQ